MFALLCIYYALFLFELSNVKLQTLAVNRFCSLFCLVVFLVNFGSFCLRERRRDDDDDDKGGGGNDDGNCTFFSIAAVQISQIKFWNTIGIERAFKRKMYQMSATFMFLLLKILGGDY
ncbi:unnamed protein product [Sphenostylis stenocarpa]|uniref:Uncharacterized protein n=1 Tax=Sphenostylis stenocarpa TaxID=92480 RepID=A0AA86TGK2_9FABA|nr:unnamed protein product [Sphenostylis stenocarpa]